LSSTTSVPRTWRDSGVLGSTLLEDPRLDHLLEKAGREWARANEAQAKDRDESKGAAWATSCLAEGACLHMRRGLKNLRAGKELPQKTTPAQENNLLRNEDLPQLNNILLDVIHHFILDIAQALGDCAVMFSDPKQVAKLVDL